MKKLARKLFGISADKPSQGLLAAWPLQPVSTQFGYDRGGPIDRYFIEKFLQQNSHRISGNVLEVGDSTYTNQFGGAGVLVREVLHIDRDNKEATIIGDLTSLPQVAPNSIDCIILTQTLHLIYDYSAALQTCYRILKPGGCLLLTVPGISHIAQDEWGKFWQWSFTPNSIRQAMADSFPGSSLQVDVFGNVKLAAAFLYGYGLPELSPEDLAYTDPHYPLIITVAIIKQGSDATP